MKQKPIVTFILGTRPEAIKLAPVIIKFKSCLSIKTKIILTGQHKEMVKTVMDTFELVEDLNINLMTQKQSLCDIASKTLIGLEKEFKRNETKLVIVQGDTSTAFSAALAAFYNKIPIGHVEAGLRTNNLFDPYPEEANRRMISEISSLNFAPTNQAKDNLKSTFISANVTVTGNTVIDAIKLISEDIKLPNIKNINWEKNRVLIATIHRRENWGTPLEEIAKGLLLIITKYKEISILIPLHKNKLVRDPIVRILGGHPRAILVEPLEYKEFIGAMKGCSFILTDSGGLQEEASSFSKPVLVLRDTTERQEAVDSGLAKLVGANSQSILKEASLLIDNPEDYIKMTKAKNPFGDGNASKRILDECLKFLKL